MAQPDDAAGPDRRWLAALVALAVAMPGIVVRVGGIELPEPLLALLFGLSIVGAAFLLSWAAEAAQVDLSAGLAIAILALIAVLPEYAVDFVFAIEGGRAYAEYGEACGPPDSDNATPCALALANMTGANRILVGIGWSMVVLIAAWRLSRLRRTEPGPAHTGDADVQGKGNGIVLGREQAAPTAFLLLASVYALHLPLKNSITLIDTVVLVAIFIAYTIRVSKAPAGEPHLVGPAAWLGHQSTVRRRVGVVLFFVVAGGIILLVAEPFAEALVGTGQSLGISEFFLVQWLAPLASEAPELLIAGLFAWRLMTSEALTTLLSSKVNQWTLLVGTLPLVFSIAAGQAAGLPVDDVQRGELLLTAAQSLFAVSLLVRLHLTIPGALALLGLFVAQFVLSAFTPERFQGTEIVVLSTVYLVLAVGIFARHRRDLIGLLRDGFRTPYAKLAAQDKAPTAQ